MKNCFAVLSLFVPVIANAQASTTLTISNTVSLAGIARPGVNLGSNGQYSALQLTKSLNVAGGGYMAAPYWQSSWSCDAGGPTNTATSWYTNASGGTYPTNFWVGAAYEARSGATGAVLGSGTITASTANASTGIAFSLGTQLSAACTTGQDVMIVRFRNPPSNLTAPSDTNYLSGCTTASWNTTDKSPYSTNTMQSMQLPSGCNLNYYLDQVIGNATNTTNQTAINYINLNGSYTATFKAKCLTAGCQLTFGLGRIGGTTFLAGTTVSPTYSATNGAGWTTYSYPFNASENGNQDSTISYAFTVTGGTVLLQDVDVIEGSTLAGNTTVFRDAVVRQLQALHPGSLRYMDASLWCSDVADQIAPVGNRRECDVNNYLKVSFSAPLGYNDVLQLANLIGSDAWLTLGQFNTPQDFQLMVQFLADPGCSSAGGAARCALGQNASWTSVFAAAGHKIYLEFGNETWNSGVAGTIWYGDGTAYGSLVGPAMATAKSTANYSSSVIKLVADGWASGPQGWGPYGWARNVLTAAQATPNGLPDFVDAAPYTLNYLGAFSTSGANISTTGAPFVDEFAEISNLDSVTSPASGTTSMYEFQNYAFSNFGVNAAAYEVNLSDNFGIPVTQGQLNQISASVGSALITTQHLLLLQRDAKFAGPVHLFSFSEPFNNYNCQGSNCVAGVVMPLWGTERYMAAGPGQLSTWADVSRPTAIALGVINRGIGGNNNLMLVTQSGTPTYPYPGGQPQSGSNSIAANSAVPYVNCTAYSDGANHWTLICFNNNLSASENITFTGAGAPTGPVTKTVFGGSANLITDNNEDSYIGNNATPPVVGIPGSTTLASLTSDSLPPASLTVYTYSVVALSPQTITFGAIPTQSVGASLPLSASASSGLTVSYSASPASVCTVAGATASFVTAGNCGITASQAGNSVYAAAMPVTQTFSVVSATAAASYVASDFLTQGTWTGIYGSDGYMVANGATTMPSYASVNVTADSVYTWASPTVDPRALQTASGAASRIASTYYSTGSFDINLNLMDGNAHRVALYLLDWDSSARAETVSILNASTNAVLSTQSFANFHGGVWVSWSVTGDVIIKVTNTSGANAVVAGVFFDPVPAASSAKYVGVDTTTQGTWTGLHGADGNMLATETAAPPSYATLSVNGAAQYEWGGSTSVRALQIAGGSSARIASTYYSAGSFSIDVNLTDGNTHRVGLYLLDWDSSARAETITVIDANTHMVLDTENYSNFNGGEYAMWDVQGSVIIQVTDTSGANAVVAGLFFDPTPSAASATASYVDTDTSTQGAWTGKYGSTGQLIANDLNNPPSFATVSLAGDNLYTWNGATIDPRALQFSNAATSRIASTYYASGSFAINVTLTDGNTHKISLYLLDWDSTTRAETVTVIDAASHATLNSQSYSSFNAGVWAVWNVKGNVIFQVKDTNGANAVVSGVFFD